MVTAACGDREQKETSLPEKETASVVYECEDFWALYNPNDSAKILYLEEILNENKELKAGNKLLLQSLLKSLKNPPSKDSIPLTFENPLFPIHRLKKDQMGILGYAVQKEVNGQWEDLSKEDQLLRKDFGYQSIDSMGLLVSFPKTWNELYPESKPTFYWYSTSRRVKSTITEMCYLGDECLSYFQYNFDQTPDNQKEKIVFGSPFALDLDFGKWPEISKDFKIQLLENCLDCPINYQDQVAFAKLKGCGNLFFTYADSWPINDQLKAPSRSLVYKRKDGKLVTLWNSELDLFGCGCL
ncbi:MAG: hypothetical protein WC044_14515 [Crocinitomicaceae bacterium]